MDRIKYLVVAFTLIWSLFGLGYWAIHPELTQMQVILWMLQVN